MSFILIRQVWQLALTPTQQHVLMAMADYADDDGLNCYPSQPRLAWKTGLSESTVVRRIDELVAMGILKVVRAATNKAPAHYQLCLDMGKMKPPYAYDDESRDSSVTPPSHSRDSSETSRDGLGCQRDTSRDVSVKARDVTLTPDPIINLSYNQPGNEIGPFPEKAKTEKAKAETATAQKWAACVQELGVEHRTMAQWLQGSELLPTAAVCDGKPLYRLLVVNPRAVDWLRVQGGRAIRRAIGSMIGAPVELEFVTDLGVSQ